MATTALKQQDKKNDGKSDGEIKQTYGTLKKLLVSKSKDIQRVAGKHLDAERLLNIAVLNLRKNPKLIECTQISILASVLDAAMMGIIPGDGTRKGYLIPFWNGKKKRFECQFQPSYAGIISVAKEGCPSFGDVQASEVCEKDHFEYELGTNKFLKHIPSRDKNRGEITHYYMVVYFTNGAPPHFDVMTRDEVLKIRDQAPNWKRAVEKNKEKETIWYKYEAEMGKKTVVKRGLKMTPWASDKLKKLTDIDDRVEAGLTQSTLIDLDEGEFAVIETNDDRMAATNEASTSAVSLGDPVMTPTEEEAKLADWKAVMSEEKTEAGLKKKMEEAKKDKWSPAGQEKLAGIYGDLMKKFKG